MLLIAWLAACGGTPEKEPGDTADERDGACGDVTTWDVQVFAKVTDEAGTPRESVRVAVEERLWAPAELGAGTTGPDGTVAFVAEGVTSVEECWATALDYWIVAVPPPDSGVDATEDDLNTDLFNAIDDGSLVVDLRERPLVLPAVEPGGGAR